MSYIYSYRLDHTHETIAGGQESIYTEYDQKFSCFLNNIAQYSSVLLSVIINNLGMI